MRRATMRSVDERMRLLHAFASNHKATAVRGLTTPITAALSVVTTMASPPLKPPVLKAFLGATREYLSADDESPTTGKPLPDRLASLTTAYQTLLCLQLAQRERGRGGSHGEFAHKPESVTRCHSAENRCSI